MNGARGLVVMLVDDEPDILFTLKVAIERSIPGVHVISEPSARAALARLARERVDVLISDQRMPEMAGIDLLVEARRIAPSTARMMMTGYADGKLLERDINEAHVASFFSKPFRLGDVVAAIRRVDAEQAAREQEALAMARAFAKALPGTGSPRLVPEPFRGPLTDAQPGGG